MLVQLLVLSLSLAAPAAAYSGYRTAIPNGDQSPGNCYAWGHTNCGGGGSNWAGSRVTSSSSAWASSGTSCSTDGDGDGFTAGEEVGDACCAWSGDNTVLVSATTTAQLAGRALRSTGGSDVRISNPRHSGSTPSYAGTNAELYTGETDIRKFHSAKPEAFGLTAATASGSSDVVLSWTRSKFACWYEIVKCDGAACTDWAVVSSGQITSTAVPFAGVSSRGMYLASASFTATCVGCAPSGGATTSFNVRAYNFVSNGEAREGSTRQTLTSTCSAPSLSGYSTSPATYTRGLAISNNSPTATGCAPITYAVSPSLPGGLALSSSTGVISGTPSAGAASQAYAVTATNSAGSSSFSLTITVNSDCVFSWSAWGACSDSSTQTRSPTVTAQPTGSGTACPGTESQACTPNRDCAYSWSSWGACSNSGSQTRTPTITTQASGTGTACPSTQSQSCTPNVDCAYSWSNWGACSGANTQTRTATVTTAAAGSGAACPSSPESRSCSTDVDCAFSWSAWGTCSTTSSTQTRSSTVTTQPVGGGAACPSSPQSQSCTPDVSCQFSWSAWGACSNAGTQTRSATVTAQPSGGGTACPSPESQSCTPNVDCQFTWSSWGQCSDAGTQTRTSSVTTSASGTGTACPQTPESRACTPATSSEATTSSTTTAPTTSTTSTTTSSTTTSSTTTSTTSTTTTATQGQSYAIEGSLSFRTLQVSSFSEEMKAGVTLTIANKASVSPSAVQVSLSALRLRRRLLAGVRVDYSIVLLSNDGFDQAFREVSKLSSSSTSADSMATFIQDLRTNTPAGGFDAVEVSALVADAPKTKIVSQQQGADSGPAVTTPTSSSTNFAAVDGALGLSSASRGQPGKFASAAVAAVVLISVFL